MKLKFKFKSLSLLLAVVLFFGVTLTPTTTNAAMKSKKMKVVLTAPNNEDTYSRFNSSRTSKDFIGKASTWLSFNGMVTISDTQNVYYNPNSRTTNHIRMVKNPNLSFGWVEEWFTFYFTADQIENNDTMRIKFDEWGDFVGVSFD